MPFPLTAHFSERRSLPLPPEDLFKVAKAALHTLSWAYTEFGGHELRVRRPPSNWSWGETLTIKVLPDGVLAAESRSFAWGQFFDLGRNRKNVAAFFAAVEQQPH